MPVTIRITVEDIVEQMLTYESIELHRSDTLGGAYTLDETETLVAGQFHYAIADAEGDLNKWYKYRFHHATGPVNSAFSDPFRVDGVTRLRGRQAALAEYGGGIVILNSGTDADKVTTVDYRVKSSLFRDDRGKGTWLLPTSGDNAEVARIISTSDPTLGTMTVLPAWGNSFADGDEVEWHWLADPTVWNDALNRGMARYYYVDRVPLKGVANQEEYDLSSIPWIIDKDQITDLTWYPTTGKDVEQSYAAAGKWWKPRIDREKVVLAIYPPVASTVTLYLYTTRPMPPLHTDASAAPAVCAEELVAALTYDEVLAHMSRPVRGSADDRRAWTRQRLAHAPELRRLLWKHRPKSRYGRSRLASPPVVPRPYRAR
ncbi:hypothetical protein LCGC14_1464290 [marine sediment metagenome]|uniref:Uncharacterized protein n=1 Tax=marine sediment metagenome TaxID=412755 RepID=A0A0F9JE68_9ZZZZ